VKVQFGEFQLKSFLLAINLWFLLRETGASSNLKIYLMSPQTSQQPRGGFHKSLA
jgi:hypothetical protein